MQKLRVLLDTNVIIPVEDPKVISPELTRVFELLSEHCEVFAHVASKDDLGRDKDAQRREISLSKLAKYPQLEKSTLSAIELAQRYGAIVSDNDLADCHLLHAVAVGAADILITSDTGLFRRARNVGQDSNVLSPTQFCDLLDERYATVKFALKYVAQLTCDQLNFDDPLWASLGGDYDDFESWKRKIARERRPCWVVQDGALLAGVVIFKEEGVADADVPLPGPKILKLSTFKVSEKHRGGRLGELLLRQAMWYAYANAYNSLYVTAFEEKQKSLVDLLSEFGFDPSGRNARGELVLAKSWDVSIYIPDPFDRHTKLYPLLDVPSEFLIVPIQSQYYQRLFPESSKAAPGQTGDLFADAWTSSASTTLAVATSIRKVYVCNSNISTITRGDVALFYFSKDEKLALSQSLAAVGVVERFERISDANKLVAQTAKRTVYTPAELRGLADREAATIWFVFTGYLNPAFSLAELTRHGVLAGPPQSIMRLQGAEALWLKNRMKISQVPI